MCYFHLLFFTLPNRLDGRPWWLSGKESTCQCRRRGIDSGLGKSPGEGNGNRLQYSCLENPWMEEPGKLQSMGSQRVGHD